ncbi:related to oligosaccharyltransferase delta subunit (ribophorin II) [Fusarium torulosum]|uniref:Related to oligosaccharyltransferase delta subunit (Ribophorin II) n=1 Tax=Fusarium torulosum TaxID=33205 RepID=A0AAE8MNE5_9HYPO|nr:related to oligosaccharyltransferase delta subunit (ribophorin II) [Fusarium torulosum]
MRFSIASSLLFLTSVASAASSWSFTDGAVAVGPRNAKEVTARFGSQKPVKDAIVLGPTDTVKVSLTTTEGDQAKRPHQAFLILNEETGLEAPFPLKMKASGKGTVDFSQKDLPIQLLLSDTPIKAYLVLGSFGSSDPLISPLFEVEIRLDPNTPRPEYTAPVRYGPRAGIDHVFKVGDTSPPMVISLVFVLAIVASIPALFLGWFMLGANVNHLPKALGAAPISHAAFFGSIIAIEGTFFLYYTRWNLLKSLPVVIALGVVALLSGTKALSEVQTRRLAGER